MFNSRFGPVNGGVMGGLIDTLIRDRYRLNHLNRTPYKIAFDPHTFTVIISGILRDDKALCIRYFSDEI